MKIEETRLILSKFRSAYPNAYKGSTSEELYGILELWTELFSEDDFIEVANAVKTFMITDKSQFPPVPGQIKEIMYQNRPNTIMSEQEAWSYVHKALRNSGYNYAEEFAKLPEVVQKSVVTSRQLHDWCMMPTDELQSVGKSHFLRSFRTIAQREKEIAKMPSNVKEFFKIGNNNDEQLRID